MPTSEQFVRFFFERVAGPLDQQINTALRAAPCRIVAVALGLDQLSPGHPHDRRPMALVVFERLDPAPPATRT